MSTVREARPRHQSLLPMGSVGRSPSEMQQRGGERTHGGSEDVQKSRQKWKENRISLAARVARDCQSASEALCKIWHLNIEILRYYYYPHSANCRPGNCIPEKHRTEMSLRAGWGRVIAEESCVAVETWKWTSARKRWRAVVESYPENMCQDCTSHHSGHLTPHVDTHLGRNILSSFVRRLVRFLTFLNNSAPARIARSYSVLNMPKRATDKGQEARLQLALLLHTIGRQIHFVTMHAALWAINFVPGPILSFPSRPPPPITTSQVFLFR